jgi:hypothetical protein
LGDCHRLGRKALGESGKCGENESRPSRGSDGRRSEIRAREI